MNQRVIAREARTPIAVGRSSVTLRNDTGRSGGQRSRSQWQSVVPGGMSPVRFYELRDAAPAPSRSSRPPSGPSTVPSLAANPFRVFTSMLVPEDRRFFDSDLEERLRNFLDARVLFPRASSPRPTSPSSTVSCRRRMRTGTWTWPPRASRSPRTRSTGRGTRLERISGVAADIGGVTTTHINHLTPRVLDIDDLYESMEARGIEMIDEIQGPPRWEGPDVRCCVRRRSVRSRSRAPSGNPTGPSPGGALRVRFGEVEARGIALTPAGGTASTSLVAAVDRRLAADPDLSRADVAPEVWSEAMPSTERDLCLSRARLLHVPGRARRRCRTSDAGTGGGLAAGGGCRTRPQWCPAPRADRVRGLPAPVGRRHLRLEPDGQRNHGRRPGWRRARPGLDGRRHGEDGQHPERRVYAEEASASLAAAEQVLVEGSAPARPSGGTSTTLCVRSST